MTVGCTEPDVEFELFAVRHSPEASARRMPLLPDDAR